MSRDANGQFAKGNPGGPGRPPRATETDYLNALTEVVTLDDWRQIGARAVADAKTGDKAAREWLSKYLIGDSPPTLRGHADFGTMKVEIIRDPNFYGNAEKVAASEAPDAIAKRQRWVKEFLAAQVQNCMKEHGLPPDAT